MKAWATRAAGAALLLGIPFPALADVQSPAADSGWPAYEGGAGAMHYSPLEQINRDNVVHLERAWSYPIVDVDVSCEPLVLGDRLIVVGQGNSVAAIGAGDGREIWRTEPNLVHRGVRGFSYWRSADGERQRVLFVANDGIRIRALDPESGRLVPGFEIDLRQGLNRDPKSIRRIAPTTPGRIFENLVIVGSITGEGYDSLPGDVRAFDVLTGELVWSFHTIPRPGTYGHETWPEDAWTHAGGANVWGGVSIDDERGIAYFVTGSPSYDFYGANRIGTNLFGNSLVAVDARTGEYLWHFQAVHHDLWDYDLTASPVLMTVRRDGRTVPAVALATKHGFLFVFDQASGQSLFPIEERPVPASDVPGEVAWPTQPFSSLPPFARQIFTEADIDPLLPEAERDALVRRIRQARNEGLFTPPSLQGTVQMPGNHGGANWGQTGADPSGRFFVVSFDLPALLQLKLPLERRELERIAAAAGKGAAVYAENCQLCHGPVSGDGQGSAPPLAGIGARLAKADLRSIVRGGRMTMPAFPEIPEGDFDALIDYLRDDRMAVGTRASGAAYPSSAGMVDSATSSDGVVRYRSDFGHLLTSTGNAAIEPPWQSLTAYDLNTGRILWQTPVGTVPGREAPTGRSFVKGGLAITAGGLVFVASEADRELHAFDAGTGEAVWSADLPSHPRGGLVVYLHEGRQYIVVPAGFGGFSIPPFRGSKELQARNAYVAFALCRAC